MKAVDASKYTVAVTPAVIAGWREQGVGLVIIQAHPAGYGEGRSLEIIRTCVEAGMPWDAYIYQYMGAPDWQQGALRTLNMARNNGYGLPRQLWLDVEDVDTEAGWSAEMRWDALRRDLALCDAWTEEWGVRRTGLYSALWYWPPKMGNSTEWSDRELWDADYDQNPDAAAGFTPYGGWALERRRIKQYAGSQPDGTDLDVLSLAEEAELNVTECADLEKQRDGLVVTVADIADRLGDALLAECKRSSAPRKTVVRDLVAQMAAEREQAIGARS